MAAEVNLDLPTRLISLPSAHLLCTICHNVYQKPVISVQCGHTFCRECLLKRGDETSSSCPIDNRSLLIKDLVLNRSVYVCNYFVLSSTEKCQSNKNQKKMISIQMHQQVCIPVGCVPPACLPYPVAVSASWFVGGGGGEHAWEGGQEVSLLVGGWEGTCLEASRACLLSGRDACLDGGGAHA